MSSSCTGTAACRTIGPPSSSGGHKVHGRAADAHAVLERLRLRVEARETPAAATDGCSECDSGNASSSGAPTRRMNPARQTSSTSRVFSDVGDRAVVVDASRMVAWHEHNGLECRRRAPGQPGRVGAIRDRRPRSSHRARRSAIASMIDWRLLPRPEMRTPRRRFMASIADRRARRVDRRRSRRRRSRRLACKHAQRRARRRACVRRRGSARRPC